MTHHFFAPDEASSISFDIEPSLDELLTDPLLGFVLRRDGLTAQAVRREIEQARHILARRDPAQRQSPALRRAA